MSTFYFVIDFVIIGCGVYIIGQYMTMVRKHEVGQSMLPKNVPASRCKDIDGYIKKVGPRMIGCGVALVLCGFLDLMQDILMIENLVFSIAVMVVFLVVIFWYGFGLRKAVEDYFR